MSLINLKNIIFLLSYLLVYQNCNSSNIFLKIEKPFAAKLDKTLTKKINSIFSFSKFHSFFATILAPIFVLNYFSSNLDLRIATPIAYFMNVFVFFFLIGKQNQLFNKLKFETLKYKNDFIKNEITEYTKIRPEFIQTSCGICTKNFENNQNLLYLACKHYFCLTCILSWFIYQTTCPLCQRNYNEIEIGYMLQHNLAKYIIT